MSRNIAFFDTGVEQYLALAQGLPADVERVVLDHRLGGIEQIGRHLQARGGIAAIHIVCHGRPGALCLGSALVDSDALTAYRPWLRAIGRSLAPGGDIVLYGCDVAAGDAGLAFVEQLAALTGANVAAASRNVGATALGGVAEMDVYIGAVSAQALFSQAADGLGVRLGSTTATHVPSGSWFGLDMFGNAVVGDGINAINEVDYFRFVQPVIGGVYKLSVVSTDGLDPIIRIYNHARQRKQLPLRHPRRCAACIGFAG